MGLAIQRAYRFLHIYAQFHVLVYHCHNRLVHIFLIYPVGQAGRLSFAEISHTDKSISAPLLSKVQPCPTVSTDNFVPIEVFTGNLPHMASLCAFPLFLYLLHHYLDFFKITPADNCLMPILNYLPVFFIHLMEFNPPVKLLSLPAVDYITYISPVLQDKFYFRGIPDTLRLSFQFPPLHEFMLVRAGNMVRCQSLCNIRIGLAVKKFPEYPFNNLCRLTIHNQMMFILWIFHKSITVISGHIFPLFPCIIPCRNCFP